MPISLKSTVGGGSVVEGSVIYFPTNTPPDVTIEGVRYLRSGLIEKDTAKFDEEFYKPTIASYEVDIQGIANVSNGGVFGVNDSTVVVFYEGRLYKVSTNAGDSFGTEQTIALLTTNESVRFIEYHTGSSLWVAAISSGKILTSPDLTNWTLRFTPASYDESANICRDLNTQGNSVCMALSSASGNLVHSTNATSWTAVTASNQGLNSVVGVGNNYIMTTASASNKVVLHTSNLTSFTQVVTNSSSIVSAANSVFFAQTGTRLLRSTNGTTWTSSDTYEAFRNLGTELRISYQDGIYWANFSTAFSLDGLTWSLIRNVRINSNINLASIPKKCGNYYVFAALGGSNTYVGFVRLNGSPFAGTPELITYPFTTASTFNPSTLIAYLRIKE